MTGNEEAVNGLYGFDLLKEAIRIPLGQGEGCVRKVLRLPVPLGSGKASFGMFAGSASDEEGKKMDLLRLILIVAAIITAVITLIAVIKKITAYYKRKYGFSIWSGVLFLEMALIFAGFDVVEYNAGSIVLWVICILLLCFTLIQDIRLAKAMGVPAFAFQIIMSATFLVIIAIAVVGYIWKVITKRTNAILNIVTGTTKEFRDGIMSLADFLRF